MSAPTPFGKYQLIDRISLGGMAEVFRAKLQNDRAERLFAIKKILPSLCEDQNFIKMFVEEARLAGQLVHPNICAIHELGRADGAHFLSMEYIWGKDLIQVRTKLRKAKQKVPLEICIFILARVLEGLDYAHKKKDPLGRALGLVHRDLSPHNVLISYSGDVKVIDFGIAKADSRASMTQAGTLKGKFAYMSPEQVAGGKLDRRSDIFALGTLLYELVTGERLFFGESDFNTLERVRKVEIKPPRDIDPTIPEGVEAIMYKALAKEVVDRYQWCNEMRADLEPFLTIDATVVSAWMHQVFATEIPVEREQIEFGLAMGRGGRTPASVTAPLPVGDVAIPAPAQLAPKRAPNAVVVEDQRSRSGNAGSGPRGVNVERSSSIRPASAVRVEDNRSQPGGFRPPTPVSDDKPRRISAPIDTQPGPAPTIPRPRTATPIPAPAALEQKTTRMPVMQPVVPMQPPSDRALRRTKAPSVGDDFSNEPPTQEGDVPAFHDGDESDWSESQQPMDWSESLELSEHAAQQAHGTETDRRRPQKWTEKVATEPAWSEWSEQQSLAAQQWNDGDTAYSASAREDDSAPVILVEHDPPVDTLDAPNNDVLDFDQPVTSAAAPMQHPDDDFLDLNVEVAPPDDEPEPPAPEPPPPDPEPANPRVFRLGGGKFRPNRNR